jgi:hypothetical protein
MLLKHKNYVELYGVRTDAEHICHRRNKEPAGQSCGDGEANHRWPNQLHVRSKSQRALPIENL